MKNSESKKVLALPVLLGSRSIVHRDFNEFANEYNANGYAPMYFDYSGEKCLDFNEVLDTVKRHVEEMLADSENLVAIFLILSGAPAQNVEEIMQFVSEVKKEGKIIVYPIVWGGGTDLEIVKSSYAADIYLNMDAPSAGASRLATFIQRVLGYDLPSGIFPNYDMGTIIKIANHINHENFNFMNLKEGSFPKYPFRDGNPHFPVLFAEVDCPKCGGKRKVSRHDIDESSKVKLMCHYPCGEEFVISDVEEKFDPWPEYRHTLGKSIFQDL